MLAMESDRHNYHAPALERGIEILELMAQQEEPISVSEIGRTLGKSRSELFRMIVVLERLGYLARSEGERFALTKRLFDIAMRAPPQRNLLLAALPAMQRLARHTEQSCHLSVASGSDIVVVARVESPDMLGFSLRVGFRRPLNLSASGRVLYAYQSEAVRQSWRKLLASDDDEQRWLAVERDAASIVTSGFHVTPSFYVDAVTDLAAPIFSPSGDVAIAALVVPFITGRSTKISLTEAVVSVRSEASAISESLKNG